MSIMSIKNIFHFKYEVAQTFSADKGSTIHDAAQFCRDAGAIHVLNNLYSEGCSEKEDSLFRHPAL